MHIAFRCLELRITEVAPEDRGEAEFVRIREGLGNFSDLSCRLIRSEVDRCAHRDGSHVSCLINSSEHYLVELVWVGQQLVMIDLYDERDLVCEFARNGSEYAKG